MNESLDYGACTSDPEWQPAFKEAMMLTFDLLGMPPGTESDEHLAARQRAIDKLREIRARYQS